MEYRSKHGFSVPEKLVMGVSLPLGNYKYRRIKKEYPETLLTVKELCIIAGISINHLNRAAIGKQQEKVSGVYRAGSRFVKDCICVQLYEDGDELMYWACAHGAVVCVTRQDLKDIPCIVVDEPAAVYASMCSYYRKRNAIEATTIVGSIGKTTTKKMVEAVYRTQFDTFCDAGNENQLDGVGYIAQHIPYTSEKWIQEVSEDTPGCIKQISRIVTPSINIVTAIDKSHIEEYGDENGIIDEIRSIQTSMKDDAKIITSMDEENTRSLFRDRNSVIYVSIYDKSADYYANSICIEEDGIHFSIVDSKKDNCYKGYLKSVYAIHNVYSALYAFAAGVCAGISCERIMKGLSSYRASGIRQNVYRTNGITVYADCYNAVARSVRSAVQACDTIPASSTRIAVIGDVEEAGAYSEAVHNEIVDIISNSKFDILLTYGIKMKNAVENRDYRKDLKVKTFLHRHDLNNEIKRNLKRGCLILFKASHKSRLDKCINAVFPVTAFDYAVKSMRSQIIWRIRVINSWTL